MKRLTTTSYALLGLLSLRTWSAYDLANQMQRGMSLIWPRAERGLYEEPKNLVAHGLARATVRRSGARRRTEYSITDEGRQALSGWLARPSAPPQLESESLVRLLFVDSGTLADAHVALQVLDEHAASISRVVRDVSAGYLAGEGPFPERVHLVALTGRFLLEYARALERYADWARGQVAGWDDVRAAEASPRMRQVLAELHAATSSPGEPVR